MLQKIIIFLISLFSCNRDFVLQSHDKFQKETTCVSPILVNPPVFRGGVKAWKRYLQQNIDYPLQAQNQKIQGVIKVQITIDINGNITEAKSINDLGGGLAEEAKRVIKKSPKWRPAIQDVKNGKKVSYKFIQNVTYKL